jgi:hypothetical protein
VTTRQRVAVVQQRVVAGRPQVETRACITASRAASTASVPAIFAARTAVRTQRT